jgi:hypothetical protein
MVVEGPFMIHRNRAIEYAVLQGLSTNPAVTLGDKTKCLEYRIQI